MRACKTPIINGTCQAIKVKFLEKCLSLTWERDAEQENDCERWPRPMETSRPNQSDRVIQSHDFPRLELSASLELRNSNAHSAHSPTQTDVLLVLVAHGDAVRW